MNPIQEPSNTRNRTRSLLLMTAAAAAAGTVVALATSPPAKHGRPATAAHHRALPWRVPGRWSAPVTVARCSQAAPPRVVFPQETPFRRTGAGAVVFVGASSCLPGGGAALAPIYGDDLPAAPHSAILPPPATTTTAAADHVPASASHLATTADHVPASASHLAAAPSPAGALRAPGGAPRVSAGAPGAPLTVAATSRAQIVLAGKSPGQGATLVEGPAGGAPDASRALAAAGSPLGIATAYLGDVAIASVDVNGGVQIAMQRHFMNAFPAPVALGGDSGPKRALAVALDYRTDALAVWWQQGWLWARERHANGPLGPLQRFAPATAGVQLTTLISDDGRAIVVWLDPTRHGGDLYLDISAPGMRLGRGTLIERLRWKAGPPPEGSVRLVRLSTESVFVAWTGTRAGRFVVRAAGIDLEGVRTAATISARGEEALLSDLATGPRGDAVATWIDPRVSSHARNGTESAVVAARGVPSSRGVPRFEAPERVARGRGLRGAAVAVDPASDRPVACWRELEGAIRCARRVPSGTGTARAAASS